MTYNSGYNWFQRVWYTTKRICIHKYWVLHFCHKAGITFRGIKHDLSKFSPTEFGEAIKYYHPDKSYIRVAKEYQNGLSKGLQHHLARNSHHYEYWRTISPDGRVQINPMPFEDSLELVCDSLAAMMTYHKKLDFEYELKFWEDECKEFLVHPNTREFVHKVLSVMVKEQSDALLTHRDDLQVIYNGTHKE